MVATMLIADDDPVALFGLRTILKKEKSLEIIAEASDGLQAVQLAEKLKPDIAVMDVVMPGLNGVDAAKQIAKRSPKTKIVMLSVYDDVAHAAAALRNGALGYVFKRSQPSEIIAAIRRVARGERYLSPPFDESAIQSYVEEPREKLEPYRTLTAREREVLHLAAEGLSNPKIAERLGISPRTVETHRANLMRKLGLGNQSELVRYAIRNGILSA